MIIPNGIKKEVLWWLYKHFYYSENKLSIVALKEIIVFYFSSHSFIYTLQKLKSSQVTVFPIIYRQNVLVILMAYLLLQLLYKQWRDRKSALVNFKIFSVFLQWLWQLKHFRKEAILSDMQVVIYCAKKRFFKAKYGMLLEANILEK